MAAGGGMKTMAPQACSTVDSHHEVKERKATQVFPLLANTKSQATSFAAYDWTTRPCKFLPYDA